MNQVEITFPDNTKINVEKGISCENVIKNHIGEGLLRSAIAVKLNDTLVDLNTKITNTSKFYVITFKEDDGKKIYWHSTSHILAYAVKQLFPKVKLGIGPAIAEGFYYDFDIDKSFNEEDLKNLEQKMKEIIKEDISFEKLNVPYEKAKELCKNEPYKLEMIEELKANNEPISFYKLKDWYELCKGPHILKTSKIKAIKLLKSSGAYWKGDSKNKQLQRIYGISFDNKDSLKEYLQLQEEIAKRDHRKIGKELDLFSFHDEAPGMPFFHNKGTFIWNKLVEFVIEKMYERNYEINITPMILNKSLWLQSGHWNHYKDNMYFTKIDDKECAVKPMNCPGNLLIYKAHQYSYKDLPIRAGEFGLVHRHELSGVISGLFRVRCFTQDDAHIFCTREQMESEIEDLINFIDEVYSTFGFTYHMELSTKPEDAMGDDNLWKLAEDTLENVLKKTKKEYKLNPGDGAFYGPKIDFHLKDTIGRKWQCGTIQLDFQMPEKFDLTYEGKDNQKERPVMIHRAILGSVERFMGILIENYEGKFPLWISPVQVKVLPIADRHNDYSREIMKVLKENKIRCEINDKAETMNKKIRSAELEKINYILVIGDKEQENKTVNIRTRDNKIVGEKNLNDFIIQLKLEVKEKK